MSKKKYLILSTALTGGGAENVARLVAETLPKSVCVLFENDARVAINRCPVYSIPSSLSNNRFFIVPNNLLRLVVIQIQKILHRPLATISHLEGPNFANLMTFGGGKRIIVVHNTAHKNYGRGKLTDQLKKFLMRNLYHRAHLAVGVSSEICDELVQTYGVDEQKAVFVANPIDVNRINQLSSLTYGDWRDKLVKSNYIINVASLTTQKNHELLINMFFWLRKECADLTLVLVGKGEQEENIGKLCSRLGFVTNLDGRDKYDSFVDVFFLGYQSNPYPLVAKSRLFILSSLWEGLPISLLEALALGIPCVSSNCSSGVRRVLLGRDDLPSPLDKQKIIRSSCGAIVNESVQGEDDFNLWVEAVMELLTDRTLFNQCAESAKDRADEYDIDKVRDVWLQMAMS